MAYKDNPIYGWQEIKNAYKKNGVDKHTLNLLHKSYDKYGEECDQRGEIPNGIGFKRWTFQKDADSCERGKGMMFPNY